MPAGTGFKGSGIDGQARNVWLYGSDKKATKIARIILKRFTNANVWEDYWQNKMNCVGNVVVNIGNYKCFSQNLGQQLFGVEIKKGIFIKINLTSGDYKCKFK